MTEAEINQAAFDARSTGGKNALQSNAAFGLKAGLAGSTEQVAAIVTFGACRKVTKRLWPVLYRV